MVGFGEALKNLRTGRNLSQQQLADKLYVNRSSVANWEAGRRVPDLVIITRIAQIFEVDVSALTRTADSSAESAEIIVVDDENIMLRGAIQIISSVLQSATITGFSKSSEAIEYSRKNRVAIAFLDIELGKSSGLELYNSLIEINPLTNVIFLTSYPDYAIKAWNTKASGFLVKPLDEDSVRDVLQRLRHPIEGLEIL